MTPLNEVEARVLGALMEKEVTTPEYYPLSLNALVAACNQKSSREPVMTLSERDCETALRSLDGMELVRVDHGSRVERYENRARTVFHLRRDEAALLCLLLLRGPQTPGELRGRAERLFAFDDVAQVQAALARMAAPTAERTEALVAALPRQPGAREVRYRQLLTPDSNGSYVMETNTGMHEASALKPDSRIEELLAQLTDLTTRVEALEKEVRTLKGAH